MLEGKVKQTLASAITDAHGALFGEKYYLIETASYGFKLW